MKVVYSGPVKTGTNQDTSGSGNNDRSNSHHVLMCQTASFTGSQAWTVIQPGDGATQSDLIFKALDIVIPAGSQICRIDWVIGEKFNGNGGENIYLGAMTSSTTARTDWFGYVLASGNISGVPSPWYRTTPSRWYNVGGSASPAWPNPGEDVQFCATFYQDSTDTDATAYWNHSSAPRVINVTDVDGGNGPPGVGDPIAGTDSSAAGDSGIPVGSTVVAVDTSANTITIDKDLTTTVTSGSPNTIRWSEASQGNARINVYYLQDRNATTSS